MLRATSDTAVATSVRSVLESRTSAPSSRARWRAVTTSSSERMETTLDVDAPSEQAQQGEALLEVQRRVDVLEAHAKLDHREGDLGLDPDHHGLRAAQAGHLRDRPQRARDERVHHVEGGDVDDHPARAVMADL